MFFRYGEEELAYLSRKDKKLGEVIARRGYIERELDENLFSSVVRHIVGQQISSRAQATVWQRLKNILGEINAANILARDDAELRAAGLSERKVAYIKDFAQKIFACEFDLARINEMNDETAIAALVELKGVGRWTAEMLLIFCLERKNILSFDDLAIQRGLRMLYHHKKITRELFARYQRRYSPYASIASFYLWAIAGGELEGMRDYAPAKKKGNR